MNGAWEARAALMRRRAVVTAAVIVAVLSGVMAGPAAAHVTANPDTADAPEFKVGFALGHGCDGSPTTAVRILVPEGVTDVDPQDGDGWEGEVVEEDGATQVRWSGGSVPDGQTFDLVLRGRFTSEADDVTYFPLVQECEQGEHRWIDIPPTVEEWGTLDEPAPFVRLAYRERGIVEEEPTTGATTDPGAEPTEEATTEPAGEPTTEPAGEATTGPAGEEPTAEATGDDQGSPLTADDGSGPSPVLALVVALLAVAGGVLYAQSRRSRGEDAEFS